MTLATFEADTLTIAAGAYSAALTVKQIERTWDALSHFPERRARVELQELGGRLNAFGAYCAELGAPVPAEELERFARRQVELTRRYWAFEGRCLSWFVVGPANFPTRSNQKRQASADKARAAIAAQEAAARKAVKRQAFPYGAPGEAIRGADPEALRKLRFELERLEGLQARMKAANAALRKGEVPTGFTPGTLAKLKTPDELGVVGFPGWALSNNLANIKRLKGRIAELERVRAAPATVERELAGGVRVVENAEAFRLQLFFPGKPPAEVRARLKGCGFRWAPSEGAWQRQLTANAKAALPYVLGEAA
jgi:hypothetical protein